ncbi:MAG: 50S ribosomal protein L1 [Nanoarchaeota archaeon]
MDKNTFAQSLALLRKNGPQRKFAQTIDLIINLRNLDLKQAEQQVDVYVQLPKSRGRTNKVCAFVGAELAAQAKGVCDVVVLHDDFAQYAGNKKKIKQLADSCDLFIAQMNIMPDVAKTFGRVLGPKGKMPNPKAGCVVPANANLKNVVDRLRNIVRAAAKLQMSIKLAIGKEDQADADILDNIMTVYEQVRRALPQEDENLRSVLLKLTMGAPVRVGVGTEEGEGKANKAGEAQ